MMWDATEMHFRFLQNGFQTPKLECSKTFLTNDKDHVEIVKDGQGSGRHRRFAISLWW